MSKFNSMVLPRKDIVQILTEGGIAAISEQDLLKPTPDFVSELFQRILIALDFFNEEEHEQVEFAALEHLENPDLHRDSIKIMKLCNRMKEVMASGLCAEQFTLKDLIKPDRLRTEVFISALLNFYLYKTGKMELLAPVINEIGLLEEQRRDWEDKIAQLNAEIEDHHESRERELPLIQEVDSKVKELHQAVANLNKQQLSLRKSLKDLKDKSGEMDEKISNAEFALVQTVQENTNLRSKIVQSPDKLKRSLEEKKSVREDAKNAERLAMQSFQEKSATVEVYTKVFKKMSKCLTQMEAIQGQVNSAKSVDKDLKTLKAKLSDDAILDKSLEAKLVELQGIVQQMEESKSQLEKERDVKCEEAAEEFERLKLDVESRTRDLEARNKNVETLLSEVDAITSKTSSIKKSAAAKQQVLLLKCEEVVREFDKYVNCIGVLLPGMDLEQMVT